MPGERILRPARMVRLVAVLLAATYLVAAVGVQPADAITSHEAKMIKLINGARTSRGIPALKANSTLIYRARLHSIKMASKGYIFHSTLSKTVSGLSWKIAGENVGMGPSVLTLHRAFMNSPPHKRNVLDKRFRKVGVGIKWKNGIAFMTVLFLG